MDEKKISQEHVRDEEADTPDTSTLNDGDATANSQDPEAVSALTEGGELSSIENNGPPPPPNGGYGWVCTACIATIYAHTWGLNSSYGVFLAYYLANNTFPGASSLEYAFVGSLSVSCALLISPIATMAVGKFGTRPTLFIGIAFEGASLICASFASKIWHLFLTQGIMFGLGMGFLFVPSVGIVPQWFTTHRSLANGISAAGSGLGGLLYSLASGAMIKHLGIAWTFRILGIIATVVNTICTLLVKDRNKIIGSRQVPFDASLFKRPEYLMLLGYGWFSMLGYVVLIFSLANYANEIGLDASHASLISALFNLGQALGRPFIGYFSDRTGRINMACCTTFAAAVFSFALWINGKVFGVLVLFTIVGGAVAGTFWATIAPVTAEVVGLADVPAALNLVWLVIVLPCTFSEPIALEIVAGTGKYIGTQIFVGFMYIAAGLTLVALRGWKIGEIAETARQMQQDPEHINRVVTARSEAISVMSMKAGRKRMLADCYKPGRV
ncbi:major facilitator superfamily domain-containing protein [Mariannaea sp. PMI_226]|nr:major facilitator superfamily domain-containing protein [Mariannaea sp. PMI_226]